MSTPDRLTRIEIATTIQQLPEHVVEIVGYEFTTTHLCMECNDKVGGQQLVNHARKHAGLPPKGKARRADLPGDAS